MNLILFGEEDRLGPNRIRLTDTRLKHLREILDSAERDQLRVGEINGLMGLATVTVIDEQAAELEIELNEPPPTKLKLTLVLALPRPKMLRRILRMVAEFGVAELHLINSYRVHKSYWQTPALEDGTVTEYFMQGLSQARDTVLPALHLHKRFKPFVEDLLPALIDERRAVVAHPGEHPRFADSDEETLLVIGPEGGFIPYEVEKLIEAGCSVASLGPRILRVENAVASLVSAFQ